MDAGVIEQSQGSRSQGAADWRCRMDAIIDEAIASYNSMSDRGWGGERGSEAWRLASSNSTK